MQELVPVGEVIDGELVDETCACGQPGRLIVDPHQQDVYGETVMVVLCDDCEVRVVEDI